MPWATHRRKAAQNPGVRCPASSARGTPRGHGPTPRQPHAPDTARAPGQPPRARRGWCGSRRGVSRDRTAQVREAGQALWCGRGLRPLDLGHGPAAGEAGSPHGARPAPPGAWSRLALQTVPWTPASPAPQASGLALPAGAGGPAALRGVGTPRTGAGGPAARRCLIRAMRTEAGAIRSAAWKADPPLALSLPLFEETRVASPGFAAVRRSASFICFWELNREGNSGGRRTGRRPLSALAGTGVPRSGPSLVARPGRAAQRPAPRPALEARGSLVPGPVWPQRRRCLGAAEGQGGDPRGAGASGASASPSLPGRGRAGRDLCAASWAPGGLLVQGTRREPSAAGALPSPPRPPRSGEPRQVKPLRPHPGSGSALGNGDRVHVTTHPCGHASGGRVQAAGWVTLPAPQQERHASWSPPQGPSPARRRREGRALQGALRADGPAGPACIVRAHRQRGRAGWALVSGARPAWGKEGGQGAVPGQGNTAQARQTRGGQWPLCWAPLWGATCQPAEADDHVTARDKGNA